MQLDGNERGSSSFDFCIYGTRTTALFALCLTTLGTPRAVKRAGRTWAPSTPGRLGYLGRKMLMVLDGLVEPGSSSTAG